MIAYMDESVRTGPDGLAYVVAAAVVPRGELVTARTGLKKRRLRGAPRIHWHTESYARKLHLVGSLAELDLTAVVCWTYPISRRGQERGRRSCLTALTGELRQEGIEELVIERRDDPQDRKDRRTLIDARRAGIASPDLSYEFVSAREEPMLWAADIVAGAVSAHVSKDTSDYYARFEARRLVVHRVP